MDLGTDNCWQVDAFGSVLVTHEVPDDVISSCIGCCLPRQMSLNEGARGSSEKQATGDNACQV
ncbi:MAG: hypothetical protein ABJM56_14845 [Gilvibacter sp.]